MEGIWPVVQANARYSARLIRSKKGLPERDSAKSMYVNETSIFDQSER